MMSDGSVAYQLKKLEELLLAQDMRKSECLTELLADDFAEFGRTGRVFSKADLVPADQPIA